MNRIFKIEEAQKLEKQISDLKMFLSIIETQDTTPKSQWNGLKSCIRMKKTLSVIGLWNYRSHVEIEIPEFMRIEIADKCESWIKELEDRANQLLGV